MNLAALRLPSIFAETSTLPFWDERLWSLQTVFANLSCQTFKKCCILFFLSMYSTNKFTNKLSVTKLSSYQIFKLPNCWLPNCWLPNCRFTKLLGYQIVSYQLLVTKLLFTKMLVTKLLVTNNPPFFNTEIPTKDKTSKKTLRNFYCLFPYLHISLQL